MKKILTLFMVLLSITSSAHALRVLPATDDVPDTGSSLYCPQLSQTLKRGMRDASTYPVGQVSELQNFLADFFELNERDIITGFFGRTTQLHVMNFQRNYGLPAYGIAGTLTRQKIAEVCKNETVQPSICNTYPKPICRPNQKLIEEGKDYQGCPTSARCEDVFTQVRINIVQPNIEGYYSYNQPLTVSWTQMGAIPKGSTACVSLKQESTGKLFAFPSEGGAASCVQVAGQEPQRSVTGMLTRTSGYDLAPGAYRAQVRISAPASSDGKDGGQIAYDESDVYFKIAETAPLSCTLATDKDSYALNDMIGLSWSSNGASYAQFVPDTSGKDNLQVPTDKLPPQGSQQIRASVYGNPYITLKVVGPEGQSALCQKTIPVTSTNTGPLTVQASLADPRGLGRESFPFGEQLVIKWSVSDPSDVETAGWGIYGTSETSIELRPVDSPTAAGTRIIRVAETGVFPHTFTWNVTQEGLFGDRVTPGRYYIYVNVPSKKQRGYVTGVAGPIGIGNTATPTGITVTAPNGGEQWEIGQLNTITWSPYAYAPSVINPAGDVDVYLVDEYGNRKGRIIDTGKASLHTTFNIDNYNTWAKPGRYYVEAINRVTGAKDRSDNLFTLTPRGIDLQVNGSDGPVSLSDNQQITVTLKAGRAFTNCRLYGVRVAPNAVEGHTVEGHMLENPMTLFAAMPTATGAGSYTAIYTTCTSADGSRERGDSVMVNSLGSPSAIKVLSPNGGENVDANQPFIVKALINGLKTISVALYKNDQWSRWLMKDISTNGYPTTNYTWVHQDTLPSAYEPSIGSNGAVYKIYVTGMKADGMGYVDDKSDTPFAFTAEANAKKLTMTQPSAGAEFKLGSLVPIQWTLNGFTNDNYTQIKIRLQSYNPSGVYDDVAELGMLNAFALGYPQTITADTKGCFSLGSNYCNKTVGAYIAEGKNKFIIVGEIYNNGVFQGVREFTQPFTLSIPTVVSREVQVVGVYTGLPHSTNHSPAGVTVTVNGMSNPPPVLVLSAYEPTNWTINNQSGATFEKVITLGYYDQTVTGLPTSTPVEQHTVAKDGNYAWSCAYANYETNGGCSYAKLKSWLETRGMPITAFTGQYEGGAFNIYLGAKGMSPQFMSQGVGSGAGAGGVNNATLNPFGTTWTIAPFRQFSF